jgi:hypothetical protein
MNDLADHDLSQLVRKVLPRPSPTREWQVEVIDKFEETSSCQQAATVRVHRTWRETVFDVGLQHVTRHYPLALEPIEIKDERMLLWRDQRFRLWRGITIELEYRCGQFTGELTQGPAFIAQTIDGLGLYADEDCACAAQYALSARRKKLWEENTNKRTLAKLRNQLRELLLNRLKTNCGYPSNHFVSLTPYRALLPSAVIDTLSFYGERRAPLIELENASVDAVLDMPWKDAPTLLYQLDFDINAARTCMVDPPAEVSATQHFVEQAHGLTMEEELSLVEFLR